MTYTMNGIGTHLSGERKLTDEEYRKWAKDIPHVPGVTKDNLRIATESLVIGFLPVIPLKTFVYYYTQKSFWHGTKYLPLYYPAGKGKVYWEHVKKSIVFYLSPFLVPAIIIFLYLLSQGVFG
ncbi:hypothetical protein EPN87_01930 [archaeon]|nr:MAG: hypothetical protein EPN87_01930 [archaeon]